MASKARGLGAAVLPRWDIFGGEVISAMAATSRSASQARGLADSGHRHGGGACWVFPEKDAKPKAWRPIKPDGEHPDGTNAAIRHPAFVGVECPDSPA